MGQLEEWLKRIRSQGLVRVVTFAGFSGTGYEDEAEVRKLVRDELKDFDPSDTLVCAGATPGGIGMVYPLARQRGFRTAGIVSSRAREEGVSFSAECEFLLVVDDSSWGGKLADGRLSPTSAAMVNACDVMIGIGGGAIARDELEAARAKGKGVRFHPTDMNHARATEKAARAGKPPPTEFGGEARSLFTDR
jgi:hypothetical protein